MESKSSMYSSFFDSIVWDKDRFYYNGLCFRFETDNDQIGSSENNCLRLYKDKSLMNEYQHFWGNYKDFSVKNLFEIGVWYGGSLVFWYEFFKPEKIVGIDLDRKELSEYYNNYIAKNNLKDVIKIFWATDQKNVEFLRKIIITEYFGPLDIVIDDGSHFYEETKITFFALFPNLRPGGLYIIEDWSWSLWEDNPVTDNPYFINKKPLMDFIIDTLKVLGQKRDLIHSIHVYKNFVVIERNSVPYGKSGELFIDDPAKENVSATKISQNSFFPDFIKKWLS